MCWFFDHALDADALLLSLRKTLIAYPVLCGRYNGTKPPTHVDLNNAGVPVDVCTWEDAGTTAAAAAAHLPYAPGRGEPACFSMWAHVPFVPEKKGMDPDTGSAEQPLLKVKIISFPAGGTSVGILAQHGAVDAESAIQFMIQWGRVHRDLGFDPVPQHDRVGFLDALDHGDVVAFGDAISPPPRSLLRSVPAGTPPSPPAFAKHMKAIMGDPKAARAAVVPVNKETCARWKAAANTGLPEGKFVSTDDIVTARTWQALCAIRCAQLGIPKDSQDVETTCARAWNFRLRTTPPLGAQYFGNATGNVHTQMKVGALLAMAPAEVALALRASLQACSSQDVAARGKWMRAQHAEGATAKMPWDENAMTFVVSSWNFSWESVRFLGDTAPFCFDHGAIVPVVAVFVPRAQQDGLNVYVSGPDDACLEMFVSEAF